MPEATPLPPLPPALQGALGQLPRGLREHIQRVREVARWLAPLLGADPALADLAAAAHDLARATPPQDLLKEAEHYGIPLGPVERAVPLLLHGPVAAERLRHRLGIPNGEVVEAVWWHSTLHPSAGPVARAVFLADKLDPEKVRREPFLERVLHQARADPEGAILSFLTWELKRLLERGQPVHPASVEARNALLLGRGN